MRIRNRCYYRMADGVVVKVRTANDGFYHIIGADGKELEKIPEKTEYEGEMSSTHVEGWIPVGVAAYEVAKSAAVEAIGKRRAETKKKKKYVLK